MLRSLSANLKAAGRTSDLKRLGAGGRSSNLQRLRLSTQSSSFVIGYALFVIVTAAFLSLLFSVFPNNQ